MLFSTAQTVIWQLESVLKHILLEACLSFSMHGSKMESQPSGRKDDTNPAGLMAVVKNQTEREVRQTVQGSNKGLD